NVDPQKVFIGLTDVFFILAARRAAHLFSDARSGPGRAGGSLCGAYRRASLARFLFAGPLVCSRTLLLDGSKREPNELTGGPLGPRCCDHPRPAGIRKDVGTCNKPGP